MINMPNDADVDEMLQLMSLRPRMYCSGIETGRDLIFFLKGAYRGAAYPAHAAPSDNAPYDFEKTTAWREYVYRRLNRVPPWPGAWRGKEEWMSLLLDEFGHKPFVEVHEAIGNLFRGIKDDLETE
jgi:hypothetical protein